MLLFIATVPLTKLLFAMGEGIVEDVCYETQGASVFPGSSRLGIEPKLQGGWCKTEPPAHPGSGAHPRRGMLTSILHFFPPHRFSWQSTHAAAHRPDTLLL